MPAAVTSPEYKIQLREIRYSPFPSAKYFAIMSTISLSVLGLVLNLYMPKFNYDNVNQIIKQSISLLIIILANLAFTMLPLFIAQSVSISFSTLLSLILLLYVLIFVIGLIILKINGAKLYKKLHF